MNTTTPDLWLNPRSSIDGIVWPAIPSPAASSLLAMQFSLERSQWWQPQQLEQQQYYQLKQLLLAAKSCELYAADLADITAQSSIDEVRLRFSELPLLARASLQTESHKLIPKAVPEGHGSVRSMATSGSTGVPVSVDWSQVTSFLWHAVIQRDHLWHQRNFSGKLATIRHLKFDDSNEANGIELENWGPTIAECFETGPACALSIHRPIHEQAAWLIAQNPHYLQTYPSNLDALIDYFDAHGGRLKNLQAVRTMSEALPEGLRQRCQDVLGVNIEDVYSTTEIGYIAIQCPKFDHYHIQSETILVEVLDEQNRHCEPGQVGRVVVTSLHNFAMPLLRYDIGDYAQVGAACECGRGLPVLKRILGRTRNLLTFPDGTTDWPVFNDTKFRSIAPIKQFQFIQRSLTQIDLKLVVERALSDSEKQKLTGLVLERLRYNFDLNLEFVDQIPRSAAGKYEDFISELSSNE